MPRKFQWSCQWIESPPWPRSLSRRSAPPVRLQAGCSALCSKAGSSSLYVLQEFYDELRGIEAEPVGNETVVSCHRDARLPADMADLSRIEAELVGDETVVSCQQGCAAPGRRGGCLLDQAA